MCETHAINIDSHNPVAGIDNNKQHQQPTTNYDKKMQAAEHMVQNSFTIAACFPSLVEALAHTRRVAPTAQP